MITSPYCTIGPFFPAEFVEGCDDLTRYKGRRALGNIIELSGLILEEGGKPTKNTILEIWQPDAKGVFRHPEDPRHAEADPGFAFWGRAKTDQTGRYHFTTVLPGVYDGRCPHANLMILAIGVTRRLVTTVFFSEAPEKAQDPVLDCVADLNARRRMFATREAENAYKFDIVLRGENETPFFLD
jgi:protocatechuate 3,4-dioxygenase alpha subunit